MNDHRTNGSAANGSEASGGGSRGPAAGANGTNGKAPDGGPARLDAGVVWPGIEDEAERARTPGPPPRVSNVEIAIEGGSRSSPAVAPARARSEARDAAIEVAVRSLLANLGEDPDRDGLRKTPNRVRRMYRELLAGYDVDPVALINGALFDVDYDEMVIVRDIELQSLCEHHMLPFVGRAHVAYIPNGKVVGLSKIPRIVDMYARRLQVQERLTTQIADLLEKTLDPQGVAVIVESAHMCATLRGVRKHDARMVTRAWRGAFRHDRELRRELMAHLQRPAQRDLF